MKKIKSLKSYFRKATKKSLSSSLDSVSALMKVSYYRLHFKGHHLDKRIFKVSKNGNKYQYTSSSPILKGLQTHEEIQFTTDDEIRLSHKSGRNLYLHGKYILLSRFDYDPDHSKKIFSGSISNFS